MNEDNRVRIGIERWLEYLAPSLLPAGGHTWTGPDLDQFWDILRRGAIKRQEEALRAALTMFDAGIGHFAVTMVRVAYEELVWIEYLSKHAEVAKELAILIGRKEARDGLEAQNEYIGAKGMQALGFTQRYVKTHIAQARKVDTRLREIGRSLGWGRDGTTLPSFALLARKVGREKEYKFLYQGTSRFVHFSGQEIFRRAWGEKGKVIIGSHSFARYWNDFALYWLFRIFVELNAACSDILGDLDASPEKHEEMMEWLKEFVPIPIITAGELESWNRPEGFRPGGETGA